MTYMTDKNMRTVRYIRFTVAMMMLLIFGAGGVMALDNNSIIINVMPSETEGSVSATVSDRVVTLTVVPASGYYIKASDIVVEPLAAMDRANAPRRGGVMDLSKEVEGTLYNHATEREAANIINSVTGTGTAYYVFELSSQYDGAYVTATFTATVEGEIRIPNGSSITYNANGHYILENDIEATELEALFTGSETTAFTGIFEGVAKADGTLPKITGQTHALFSTIDGGTVKNVMLDNVNVSGSTTINTKKATGAIANVAKGATRIYNCGILASNSTVTADKDGYTEITDDCSSTVGNSESDYVGGLVGFLDGEARVINCFSYAKITAGNTVGGIVGYNNVATTANSSNPSTYLKTMVMNCMFYGEIDYDNTTSRAPVYNGEVISNKDANGISNFNYFWAGASYVQNSKITSGKYNCALSAETRYLQRFEFFRHLLNSNRELAAWWASTTTTTVNKDEMMKWVLEPSQIGSSIPYPILKAPLDSRNKAMQYPSVVNIDADNAEAFSGDEATKKTQYNQGRKFGTLTINIQNSTGDGSSNAPAGAAIVRTTVTTNITDKDPAHFNFNYYKVQLPYYNDVGTKNYTDNKVVTGWKIVSMNTSKGSFSTGDEASATVSAEGDITLTTPYNFADRKSTAKDIYSATNKRVFNQGAYFDVPEGVTSITIEPYWGKCVYVSDEYPDIVYNQAMSTAYNASNVGGSSRYTNDELYPINGDNQEVYTTMGNAVAALQPSGTVYDNAIVLVGNVHSLSLSSKENNEPYTIMSIDLDKDNEPDYSYILRFDSRVRVHPVRIDFLNVIGLGMAQKSSGGTGTYNFGIMQPLGWFEVTNTGLFRVTQLEYDRKGRTNSPIILQGGVIEQWVTYAQGDNEANAVQYYHVGGNVWFKEFHIGQHQDRIEDNAYSPHPPISVTGGDYDIFYLTGYYNTPKNNYDDNAECYINGGRFGKVAGTGMQGIGSATNHTNGNIVWQIDNADIDEFYAGGINAAHIAEGNIYTVISNSRVDQFCGGPKFGDMNSNKKVVTNATNCTFRTFFGAGYGGNSYNRRYPANQNEVINIDWNNWVQGNDGLKYLYKSEYGGVETRIDYQFIPMSNNTQNVARLFVDYVSFSLATTYDVTSKLTGCTITTAPLGRLTISDDYNCLGNFYGGGSLGKVAGPVKSTLINCTVEGNAFGAGYSATLPTVAVMDDSFQTEPKYDSNLGAYLEAKLPSTVTYKWEHRDQVNSTETAIDKTNNHILYTTEDLTTLGQVTGKVTLNIEGNTLVKGNVTENNVTTQFGGVYGGGDASAALGDTEVNIDASGQQAEGYNTYNVFGGGNKADVSGSVVVNMKRGIVDHDVYGGGALANTNIGNVTAGYGTANETIPYTTTKTTTVNLQGGTINGDAYGGGLGRKAATGVDAVEATVYGDITVNLGDADASVAATAFNISNYTQEGYTSVVKSGRLFGANNLNGSPKGDVTVNIYKTVTGANNQSRTAAAAYKKKEGETGYEAPTYEVAAVYGGGNLADYTTTGKKAIVNILTCDISVESVYGGGNAAAVPATEVTVDGAYEIQYVFGGGNGKDPYTLDGGTNWTDNSGANVTGDATTVLTGGFIHEAYGASNEKGTIDGAANLQADDAGNTDDCALDVWKMVGAGKNADFFGNVNLVLGCMPESKVDAIYGGADNANVFGNVTLTVTSGNFGAVYGGNNLSGIITGQIILNIEETGCRPINIDALYLGGNQAAYSKYGYYVKTTETEATPATGNGSPGENAVLTNGKLTFLPRDSVNDPHRAVKEVTGTTWTVYTGEGNDILTPYADPILNVRSFTHIGEVFGGGYGAGAIMYANPTVNINQTYGIADELGTIGNVYGGGDAAAVMGITTVNIGTETTVDFVTDPTNVHQVKGANITGNVYGGGKLADVKDITNVNICAKDNGSGYMAVPEGEAGITIAGNVFGGGKGEVVKTGARAFYCEEAMVGVDGKNAKKTTNDSETYANYGTHVRIGHGTVNGTVYGGGEMGRVEFHTEVTIGYGSGTKNAPKSPVINGYVYGAGMGAATHGYSGLVRGNSKVTIQGDAKVGQSVYGGGEKASVGKYEIVDGLPKTPLWGGKCTVTIQGYAEIGPDDMKMVTTSGKPDDTGHVFGAGAGVLPYENVTGTPYSIQPSGKVEYPAGSEDAYLLFIRTLGLASNTDVTIGEHAFVKGSVYGGSENGYVQANTHVTIAGGQVGNGDGVNRLYTDEEWAAENTDILKECAHWPYESPYEPYDIYKDENNDGKPDAATDGHTFYGNVFGGGRGYYPYAEGPDLTDEQRALGYSKGLWLHEAGSVGGNTVVDIIDGHILTSVYGGNELTDVTGTCTINMVGGTLGVPRTLDQMISHPVTCYVFGAGKGDQRINFHNQTVVASTQVNISGTARIYGSTFGGGEDGHVIGNAETNIGGNVTIGNTVHSYSNVIIGTTGTSSVDGNIFGGGRGFSETTLTAGVVGGNVSVNIHNGKMLGSVYGGGRLASVGTYFLEKDDDYGHMQEDNETSTHGHIYITIDGGIIGATDSNGALVESDYSIGDVFGGCKGSNNINRLIFGVAKTTSITMSGGKVNGSVYGGGEIAIIGRYESADLAAGEGNTTINISGGEVGDGVTKKGGAKIGNVYGGGKGRLEEFDAGLVKGNSKITISETDKTDHPTIIYHNVYGGGAYGSVGVISRNIAGAAYVPGRPSSGQDMPKSMPTDWIKKNGYTELDNGTAEIYITGGQIGTDGDENGMVFGSSRGDVETPTGATLINPFGTDVDRNDRTAWVYNTKVVIGTSGSDNGPDIRGSVYGSGENGHVFTDTDVQIHSGKIGVTDNDDFGGANYRLRGNVYGGGCGEDDYTIGDETTKYYNPLAGIVLGNSNVTIDGGHVVHNVYGAGALGSVVNKATVEISGGQVGVQGSTGGSVYGAARGNLDIVQTHIGQVKETEVDIKPNEIENKPDPVIWNDVFGGGEAGIVTGSVAVTVSGGEVKNDVYGGGALANTNTDNWDGSSGTRDYYIQVYGLTAGTSSVEGLYTKSEDTYDQATGTAVANTTYYNKTDNYSAVPDGLITVGSTDVSDYYIKVDNNYVQASGKAVADVTYYQQTNSYSPVPSVDITVGTTDVSSYYTRTPGTYSPVSTSTAVAGEKYYEKKTLTGTWATDMNDDIDGTIYKTTLTLIGGTVGNAYGGGLGRKAATGVEPVEAMVYGDVTITVGVENDDTKGATAFTRVINDAATTATGSNVYKTGHLYGANNINGTPTGNISINIYKTAREDGGAHQSGKANSANYEIQGVYGGGNLADYMPATGKQSNIYIDGCSNVSIEFVYGGGNSASVPSTNVNINGCWEIGYAFGGGNGNDKILHDDGTTWYFKGADVNGDTHIDLHGGTIHWAFGGSNRLGDCIGTIFYRTLADNPDCPLKITTLYGAGQNADFTGNLDLVIKCPSNSLGSSIENVFGGSLNAKIGGNITMTIIGGIFDNVFGGNDQSGSIGGNITLNIQETSDCQPILIKNLYGGGNKANYPGDGRKNGSIQINVKSCTNIGNIFGGGHEADVDGNTEVNINMVKGYFSGKNNVPISPDYDISSIPNISQDDIIYSEATGLTVGLSADGYYTKSGSVYTEATGLIQDGITYYKKSSIICSIDDAIGTVGNVYAGGDQGVVTDNSIVNIGTLTTVTINNYNENNEIIETTSETVLGAHITGNVFGGGNLADVKGNTYVNIGAKKVAEVWESVPVGSEGLTIAGNVYGGGKGAADNFECDKAMVGTNNNYGANNTGSTYVHIGNGTIGNGTTGGNVYGGGMIGRVEANTNVTVGFGEGVAPGETPTSAPVIYGSLYGAGQGVATHGYSGLVRGNSTVTIMGNTKLMGSVYGGGQKATVGRFWVKGINDDAPGAPQDTHNRPTGMPYAPMAGGYCTVTIGGYAEIGPDDMMMTAVGGPDDAGHVFGACKGIIPYNDTDTEPLEANENPESETAKGKGPGRWYKPGGVYTWQPYSNDETAYLEFIETLALASVTDVTIAGNAFIKGSVYGGSENGRVLDSTYVKIQESCQIGAGFNKSTNKSLAKYDEADFIDPTTATAAQIEEKAAILQECNSWSYQAPYAPYDPNAIYQNQEDGKYYYDASYQKYAEGGMPVGSDGHTFYGNVFGGGSGYYPYKDSNTGESKWHWEAGSVGGNTRVEISGGHILTNLYGGNELTNVGHGATVTTDGKSTIVMSGGTLGVPRTLDQIAAHPVTCYLFGAGKGDQRVFFNKQTNVNDVDISITGGTIYGSVFGGGEDGHVMRDVTMVIGNTDGTGPSIGTWGTSYVDGNVFGGGRGFAGDAYTAGNVGGSIDLKIKGGTMLGSIYGGGRLGSVGYGLYTSNEAGYGEMRDDNKFDDGTTATGFKRGHVNIEISGGTIGNDYETSADLGAVINYIPNTTLDANNKLLHTKGGNVFAGGMGRREQLDGVSEITAVNWKKLGNVKSTKLTIGGSAVIKSNVYGGGEFGAVTGYHITDSKQIGAEIIINGGTIGTLIGTGDNQYAFGSVFGGGMGHNIHGGGDVENNTSVSINDAIVRNNVYGGGEVGSVGKITNFDDLDKQEGGIYLYKHDGYKVEASAANGEGAYYNFGLSWPYKFIYDNTGLASVTITGNTQIGGYVYGAAKGSVEVGTDDITQQRFLEAKIANVRETKVTIGSTSGTQPTIGKSVYGGGEDGHVYEDASIVINGGSIAHSVFGGGKGEGTYQTTLLDATPGSNQGNPKASKEEVHSWTAGKVYGNTHITMNGGSVGYNIYGGGNLASVGKGNYAGGYDDYSLVGYGELPEYDNSNLWTTSNVFDSDDPTTFVNMADHFMGSGKAYVNIYSGSIGVAGGVDEDNFPYGNVFGSSRGKAALNVGQLSPRYRYTPDFFLGYVNETQVIIGGGYKCITACTDKNGKSYAVGDYISITELLDLFENVNVENVALIDNGLPNSTYWQQITGSDPIINGSVFGGGQDGHVRRSTRVIINKGTIGENNNSGYTEEQWNNKGNVFGAGSGLGKYTDDSFTGEKYNNSSGSVTCKTIVDINGGTIYNNVYGGGALASVGPPNAGQRFDEYNTTADYILPEGFSTHAGVTEHASVSYTEVNINGGVISGNIYGASRGALDLDYNGENPSSYATDLWSTVNVRNGSIGGNVFGGGEAGLVKCGVKVNILGGTIAKDVYGGGALANTNTSNWDGYANYETLMGVNLVPNESIVTGLYTQDMVNDRPVYTQITAANTKAVANTVYYDQTWADGMHTEEAGKYKTKYNTKVNLLGGTINGDVYGGALGRIKDTENNISEINAYVYGDVTVNLNGMEKADHDANTSLFGFLTPTDDNYMVPTSSYTGAIVNRIFGGNNLKGTPKGHIKVHVFATQNSTLTTSVAASSKYAKHPVQGEKLQNIDNSNETYANYLTRLETTYNGVLQVTSAITSVRSASETLSNASTAYDNADDNNKPEALESLNNAQAAYDNAVSALKNVLNNLYDVEAVYGGGNLAAYIYGNGEKIANTDANKTKIEAARTEVIIDGCDFTSIRQVYAGGNAASVPGTFVEINGSYEIDEAFGGGNGADPYVLNNKYYNNPGANVGYYNYTHWDDQTGVDLENAYNPIDNTDASTPENRRAIYGYGSGIATTDIRGGTIHYVFGGSNKKGNISTTALSVYSESDDDCRIDIHETYGGGKDAPMDGEIDLTLDCVKDMDMIFGGSKNADVNNNITLNITNGKFKKVFGGNNTSGAINGSITVNIEEKGCVPIEIDELYGGGYLAPYSIYGYSKTNGNYDTELVSYIDDDNVERSLYQRIPLTEGDNPKNDPRINIISATRIGSVYGGGYQAKVVGSPYVNVNMTNGIVDVKNTAEPGNPAVYKDGGGTTYTSVAEKTIEVTKVEKGTNDPDTYAFTEGEQPNLVTYVYKDAEGTIYNPAKVVTENNRLYAGIGEFYATLNIGTIDSIYGGGNLADIVGNTHVEIGTGRWVTSWDANGNPIYETMDVNNVKYKYKVATPAVTYTTAECTANNAALDTISTSTVLTQKQATRINELLSLSGNDTITKGQNPTQAQVYAYNATIDGYLTTADIKAPAIWKWYDANGTEELADQTQPTPIRYAATITGDVFGGGKGKADNFTCDKAMIGINDEAADPSKRNGGTNVIIANGTVGGSVYGGGMIARVEKNTSVTIGFESGIGEPVIQGDVFGAGMGADTHGYAGLVRGNSSVTIQGNSKVRGSVYGGGKQASIGRYFVAITQDLADAHDVDPGMPYDLKSGGKATVIVRGNAEIGPDNMMMTASGGPDNTGHVFGAGKGTIPYKTNNPRRYYMDGTTYTWQSYSEANESAYLKYIETLGITNETEVLIGGNAFIKGSVYGGSESGFVRENTHVTIQDNCQIGNGLVQMADNGTYLTNPLSMNRPYSSQEWEQGRLIMTAADRQDLKTLVGENNYTSSLPECSSWPYQTPYAPYDKFADADGNYPSGSVEQNARGGRPTGSDGHTFYGNVFGGGSGYYPYAAGKWHRLAGSVGGNTVVDITGGHILTSVYGGNEHTDVGKYEKAKDGDNNPIGDPIIPVSGGKSTINMTGGTLGVPRTLGQIAAHPVTCYLFGAGKGDMRTFFNTWTNVANAEVNITGNARIYGSVFGGGEDGHILGDVKVNIGDTLTIGNTTYTPGDGLIIGTTGTSYVDGNVFGAGRGFNGGALTAGSVGGNVELNIKAGTMYGSIYGGGRMASVGIGFNAPTDANYGSFTNDEDGKSYGHVTVNISGGTIGNDREDKFYAVVVETDELTSTEKETLKNNGLQALKNTDKIPYTDFELYDSLLVDNSETKYKYLYRTVHTKGGNVFGGSMGRLTNLDNSYNNLWPQLAQVKTATVNITGGTIKSNVYGGAELGTVRDSTFVTIGGIRNKTNGTISASGSPTIYRDVYGGGYGSTIHTEDSKASIKSTDGVNTIVFGYTPRIWAGMVGIGTEVDIYGGWIKKSVYGGGEMASVGIINYIVDEKSKAMSANTELKTENNLLYFRSTSSGSAADSVYVYIVKHPENESGFALSWPYKTQYIQGYEGKATVNIKGGRIGITGKDFMGPFDQDGNPLDVTNNNAVLNPDTESDKTTYKNARMDNGDVFGGGKGLAGDRYEMAFLANVGSTEVTIDYQKKATKEATPTNYKDKTESGTYANDCITGSVYAGAENGHVMGNTHLTLNNGLIGHAIYGGGKGKGTYTQSIARLDGQGEKTISIYSITAGKVYGNTKVDMTGGYVVRNVYGGGNMGSVGKGNYAGGIDDYSSTGYGEALNGNLWDGESLNSQAFLNSGKTEVTITGGSIGYYKENDAEDSMKDGLPYGNVFGGCRGESAPNIRESPRYHYSPQFYSGYTNETKVTIGTEGSAAGPTILGSVYGGGQDGHVRRDANVTIYSGEIGIAYGPNVLKYKNNQGITDLNNAVWLHRGNVYGAGSGIGKYQYDFNYDGDFDDDDATYNDKSIKEQDYSTSAGSVTRFTNVEINGGKIHRNVYGGGSLASVGAPKIPPTRTDVPYIKGDTVTGHGVGRQSLNEVIINGGTIGDTNSRTVGYGGNVYGASRGLTELGSGFATSVWTKVEANSGHIYDNVFGGGEAGSVTMDSKVIIGGKVENTNSGSGAPRRTTSAVQPDAAAPANTNSSSNSSTVTPANVATEAPDARSIRINRANQ